MNIQGNINAIIGTLASLKLDTERNKELKQARQATEAAAKRLEEERKQFEQSPEGQALKERIEESDRTAELYEQMQRGEVDFYGNPITHDPELYNAASIDRVMNRAIQKKVALKHRTKLKGGRN